MHTTFDAISNQKVIFQFAFMVLRIFAIRMRTFFSFLCDDISTFFNFSSESKCYLDMEYNENELMSLMLLFSHNEGLTIFSTEPY